MSEYWKSTPKYWCKHCKTYVRDTKLEKANHEATPRHQGNLKRFVRDLHRGNEKDERDKERAKSEVARLNGLVAGGGEGSSSNAASGFGRGPTPSIPKPQATSAQRKQQLAQLAEMGISIPDEFRPDMAMAGEWQVTSERIIEPEDGEKNPDAIALGVRKREPEDEEEEAIEAKKRRWGSAYKTHPADEDDGDLDALLNNISRKGDGSAAKVEIKQEIKDQEELSPKSEILSTPPAGSSFTTEVKIESSGEEKPIVAGDLPLDLDIKQEAEASLPGIVFKKRKAKNIRQK